MSSEDSGHKKVSKAGWNDDNDSSRATEGDQSDVGKYGSSRDPSAPNYYQTIELLGDEQFCSNSIFGYEVNIHASQKSSLPALSTGSSKVKITTITNQNWNLINHYGYLVASSNEYLAYVLEGRNGYVIRIIKQSNSNRGLLKGFTGAITDVAFAHPASSYLAAIDQGGNLYVWKLEEQGTEIKEQLLLHVTRSNDADTSVEHRLVWCPYVMSGATNNDDIEHLFAVALGKSVEVWNLDTILTTNPVLPLARSSCTSDGIISLDNIHSDVILDLAISPDANVLATASKDGHVKFWSISSSSSAEHICLHDWTPHGGDSVSRLMFCDNLLTSDPNAPFWRFLVTAANENTEVKVWCAQTWKCLQTVRFLAAVDIGIDELPSVKLCLDLSASYLVAADTKRTVLYVLQLYQDPELGQASFTSITDHLLTQSIISFVITGPVQPYLDDVSSNSDISDEDDDDMDAMEKFDTRKNTVMIKLHCIQTKSVQELMVRFEPQDRLNMPTHQLLQFPELAELYGLNKTTSGSELGKSSSAPSSEQDSSPQRPPPAVTHIDASMIPLPETEASSTQPLLTSGGGGGGVATDDVVNKGYPLESSVDPPSLSTYMSSPLTSLTSSGGNTPLSMPVGNFASFGSQKLLSPAEFVSSPPHSLTSFPKGTPSDFSSALPLSVNNAATPTTTVHTSIAPPPMTSSTVTEVTLDSTTSDSDDGNLTPQESARKSFQDICDTLDLPKAKVDLPKMSPELFLSVVSDPVFRPEALGGDTNKTLTSQPNSTNEGGASGETLQIEGRVSQASSDFASAKDQEESDQESLELVSNEDLADTQPKTPPTSQQLFPDALPLATDQQVTMARVFPSSPGPSLQLSATSNDLQFLKCNRCSTFNSPDVQNCTHCGAAKSDQWTKQIFTKAAAQNTTDSMIAQSPSTADVAFNETTNTVESAASDSKIANTAVAVVSESLQEYSTTSSQTSTSLPVTENSIEMRSDNIIMVGGQTVTTAVTVQESYPSSSAVVAKLYPSQPVGPPPMSQAPVTGQSVEELRQLVMSQKQQMNALREEMLRQKQEMMEQFQQMLTKSFQQQENVLAKKIEARQLAVERSLQERQGVDQQRHEQLLSVVSQSLTETVNSKLDKVMKTEMKQSVVPTVSRSLTNLQENFSTVLQQKLTATDTALKEGVTKILKSKSFTDSLTSAATVALQGPLQGAYGQVFQSVILPQFDRSCQMMCQQISNVFQQGTRQYLEELQRHLEAHRHQSNTVNSQVVQQLSQQLNNTSRTLEANQKTLSDTLTATLQSSVQHQLQHSLNQLQSSIKEMVATTIQTHPALVSIGDQLKVHTKDNTRKVKEVELQKIIQNKELNKAFEVALTASDLHLVLYVCKQVDADELFDITPPCLTQPVLLSLIQHLSCNLDNEMEVKLKYLEHSILALNTSNEVTRSHMPGVLSTLCQELQQAEELLNLTSPSTARKLRKLRMVAERLAQPC
ncbi:enhancer of mRNA-decapping protein 4-like [Dysidea avara]|uniref:enhancer of mRNA-decapping protein 4-like n=1 Tax=Dysidea avara TaxID=196820 RepID=UPI00331FC6CC